MVAGDDDDFHVGTGIVDVQHRIDIEVDCCTRRCCSMEDVAAHEQRIWGVFLDDVGQLPQEGALFLTAVIAVEILAQMPVTGVNEFKHNQDYNF